MSPSTRHCHMTAPEPDTALAARFDELVRDWADVATDDLFGFRAYRANGTVFAVLDGDAVVLTRLPAAAETDLAADRETGPFEAYGQMIDSWVRVPVTGDRVGELRPYVRGSYEAAHSGTTSVPPPEEHR